MRLRKKALNIEKYDEKLGKIKETLYNTDEPLNYLQIAERTNLAGQEVYEIIKKQFAKETKATTHSGFPTDDFLLFGENVAAIKSKWSYKTLKSALDLKKENKLKHLISGFRWNFP